MYLLMRAVSAENAVRMLPSPSWLRTRAGDFQPVNRRFVPKLFNGLNCVGGSIHGSERGGRWNE